MSVAERVARKVNERFEKNRLKPTELDRLFDEEIEKENLDKVEAFNVRSEAAIIAARLRVESRRAS